MTTKTTHTATDSSRKEAQTEAGRIPNPSEFRTNRKRDSEWKQF